MTQTLIKSFHPPVVELPDVDPIPAGEFSILLPALRVTWGALDLLPEYKVGGELPGYAVTMTAGAPIARADLAAMVAQVMPQLEEMHRKMQEALDSRGPIYDRGQLPPVMAMAAIANSWGR